MNAPIPLIFFGAISLGGSLYLYLETRRRLRRYWGRSCTGRAWMKQFPAAEADDVRRFLLLFVGSFGFSRKRALQFTPTDRVLDIYRALNPLNGMPDALELETLARRVQTTYGLDLVRIWREDITLGEVFANANAAV